MTRAHLLVTGGSGYLGQWVTKLTRKDWDVTATYLTHPLSTPDIKGYALDLRDRAAVKKVIEACKPDVIIHTAAANPGPTPDYHGINVIGTQHIAQNAAACGARLIHLSTDVIFNGKTGNYDEQALPTPITDYGKSKAQAETIIQTINDNFLIVRTSLIYGWHPHVDRHTRWILKGLQNQAPPRLFTDEMRCPIWVECLASALIELAKIPTTGILNVAGAQALSRYDFGARLARFHGLDPKEIIGGRSAESGMHRPLDCTLNCAKARALLKTPLPGVDAVLCNDRENHAGTGQEIGKKERNIW